MYAYMVPVLCYILNYKPQLLAYAYPVIMVNNKLLSVTALYIWR